MKSSADEILSLGNFGYKRTIARDVIKPHLFMPNVNIGKKLYTGQSRGESVITRISQIALLQQQSVEIFRRTHSKEVEEWTNTHVASNVSTGGVLNG